MHAILCSVLNTQMINQPRVFYVRFYTKKSFELQLCPITSRKLHPRKTFRSQISFFIILLSTISQLHPRKTFSSQIFFFYYVTESNRCIQILTIDVHLPKVKATFITRPHSTLNLDSEARIINPSQNWYQFTIWAYLISHYVPTLWEWHIIQSSGRKALATLHMILSHKLPQKRNNLAVCNV
jgi:hypothetical protein